MTEQQIKYDQMVFSIWLGEQNAEKLIKTANQLRGLLSMPAKGFSPNHMRIIKQQHRKAILEQQVKL